MSMQAGFERPCVAPSEAVRRENVEQAQLQGSPLFENKVNRECVWQPRVRYIFVTECHDMMWSTVQSG